MPLAPLAWAFIFSTRALVVEMTLSSSQMERTLGFAMVALAQREKFGSCSRPAFTDGGSTPAPDSAKMRSRNGAMLTYHGRSISIPAEGSMSISTYLSERQLLAAAEERVRIRQQRLNLLVHSSHPLLGLGLLLLVRGGAEDGEHE